MQQRFLLQILLLAQHVSGTTMPIIRSSRLYSLLQHVAHNTLFKAGCVVWCGAVGIATCCNNLYILELLMVGIIVPETC